MTQLFAPAPSTDQAEAVLQVFQAATHPLTIPQAEKVYSGPKLNKKKKEFQQIVESQLLMQGKLFKCSPSGKTPRYWAQDEEQKVREKIEELLQEEHLTEKDLASAVNKALPKISSTAAIKHYIQTMQREGLVHERPGKAKAMLLSLQPLSPFDAISFTPATLKNLSKALTEVESLGGNVDRLLQMIREQLRLAARAKLRQPGQPSSKQKRTEQLGKPQTVDPTPQGFVEPRTAQPEIDDLILKGMHDLDYAVDQGASVLLRDLRRHMPTEYRGHDMFDAAVLRLADQDRIVLHRDDHPAGLTEAERDELVRDEHGTFYISIAKRV